MFSRDKGRPLGQNGGKYETFNCPKTFGIYLNSESDSVVLSLSGKLLHCFAAWKEKECILQEIFGWGIEVQACGVPEGCNHGLLEHFPYIIWCFAVLRCFNVPVPVSVRSAGAPDVLRTVPTN